MTCEHEGIECETQIACAVGCTCPDCLEAINTVYGLAVNGDTSDGCHTFNDLYDHRLALTVALTRCCLPRSWRSKAHHPGDDPMFEGHFIVGIDLPTGTITYHYKLKHWDLFNGSTALLAYAPKWDGAGPDETVKRLKEWQPYG